MPVRIYDIAKKLGVESHLVLAKAKELGIAAKVPSSHLDKITAEYLELEVAKTLPPPAPPAPTPAWNYSAVEATVLPPPTPATLSPPPAPALPQPKGAASQRNNQPVKPLGITLRTTNAELHGLFERILTGDIPFVLEVSRDEGSVPIRAKLVPDNLTAALPPKPRIEPPLRAEMDDHTKRIFLGAYYFASSVSKDDGWVNLAEYGSTLKKQDPTFQPMDFGEKSLGALVRRIGIFDFKTDGNTPPVYFIRLKPQAASIPAQPVGVVPQNTAQTRCHATGKIHNLKLGFGFIAPDDGSDNAFFHATEVIGCTIFDLRPGDPVEYEAGVNERGPCAWKIRCLTGNPETRTG